MKLDEDQLRHFLAQGHGLHPAAHRGGGFDRYWGFYRSETRAPRHGPASSSTQDFRRLPGPGGTPLNSVPDSSAGCPFLRGRRALSHRGLAGSGAVESRFTELSRCTGSCELLAMTISAPVTCSVRPRGSTKPESRMMRACGLQLANALNQFRPVHARHAVIRHHHIEVGALEEFQALFTVSGDLHAISHFFE